MNQPRDGVSLVNMQRFAHVGRLLSLGGVVAVLALVTGCGGSSASSDPWDVVRTQHNASSNYGIVNGDVGQPSQVEVTVVTKPRVNATTHFTIACGSLSDAIGKNKFGPKGMTPLTFRITVPTSQSGPSSCFVQAGADYPSNVDTTITLLQRDVPATTSTG